MALVGPTVEQTQYDLGGSGLVDPAAHSNAIIDLLIFDPPESRQLLTLRPFLVASLCRYSHFSVKLD